MAWVTRAVFPALFVLGAVLRVTGSGDIDSGAGVPQHAAGLGLAVLVYVVLLRWGTWRWLAALASAPGLVDERVLAAERTPGWAFLIFALVSVVVAGLAWRPWPRTMAGAFVAAVGVLLVGALLFGPVPVGDEPGAPAASGVHLADPLLLLCAFLGVLAVVGVARAAHSLLQPVVAVAVVAPLVASALMPAGSLWWEAPLALVWWPAAGALGLTAIVRGRRGRSVSRPQSDGVDADALAAFRARYGDPELAPVVIVIAAYNEADGIRGVLADLPGTVCGLRADVLVVDDGSSDGTAEAVEGTRAYVCPSRVNRGQGAALRLGYRIAREHGASYIITTDADGQYDVADFPAVLAPLLEGRADFVTGSRVLGDQLTHDRVRRVGVHVFAWIVTLLTGQRVTDTSFGLRAMRAELTGRVTLNQPQYQSSELLLGALSRGYRVAEVPGTMRLRSAGTTKKGRNLVYGSRYARVVLGTWWREGCPRPVAEVAPAIAAPSTIPASTAAGEAPGRVDV